jgi:hypothetical protein
MYLQLYIKKNQTQFDWNMSDKQTNKQTNTHANIQKIWDNTFVYQSTYCTNTISSQY